MLENNIQQYEDLTYKKHKQIEKLRHELKTQNETLDDAIKPELIRFRKKYEKLRKE